MHEFPHYSVNQGKVTLDLRSPEHSVKGDKEASQRKARAIGFHANDLSELTRKTDRERAVSCRGAGAGRGGGRIEQKRGKNRENGRGNSVVLTWGGGGGPAGVTGDRDGTWSVSAQCNGQRMYYTTVLYNCSFILLILICFY